MTGMCEGCTKADLELECTTFETFDMDNDMKYWDVKCVHSQVCTMWKEKQKKKKERRR